MVRFAKSRQGPSFVGIFAMIQCIRSSSMTGYMLMKVRHDLLEVGFVKVPGDDRGSVRAHTPPPLVFPASAVLSIRKTEKLSDGLTGVSGTDGVSVSNKLKRLI